MYSDVLKNLDADQKRGNTSLNIKTPFDFTSSFESTTYLGLVLVQSSVKLPREVDQGFIYHVIILEFGFDENCLTHERNAG